MINLIRFRYCTQNPGVEEKLNNRHLKTCASIKIETSLRNMSK